MSAEEELKRIILKKTGWPVESNLDRKLIYCPLYSYGRLTTLIFQLEGSPPRGTMIAYSGSYSLFVDFIFFGGDRVRRRSYDSRLAELVKRFMEEKGIPELVGEVEAHERPGADNS